MDVRTSRETYMARAAKYVDAHVTTTDGRCGQVIATAQRRHNVIVLIVRSCATHPVTRVESPYGMERTSHAERTEQRARVFRTDNEHSTISQHRD